MSSEKLNEESQKKGSLLKRATDKITSRITSAVVNKFINKKVPIVEV